MVDMISFGSFNLHFGFSRVFFFFHTPKNLFQFKCLITIIVAGRDLFSFSCFYLLAFWSRRFFSSLFVRYEYCTQYTLVWMITIVVAAEFLTDWVGVWWTLVNQVPENKRFCQGVELWVLGGCLAPYWAVVPVVQIWKHNTGTGIICTHI